MNRFPLKPNMTEEDWRKAWAIAMDPELFDMCDELKEAFLHFIPGIMHRTVINYIMDYSRLSFEELMKPIFEQVYAGYEFVTWFDVNPGDLVYVDNYQSGKFYKAAPRISGPYRVVDPEPAIRRLRTTWRCGLPSELKKGGGFCKEMTPREDEPILILKDGWTNNEQVLAYIEGWGICTTDEGVEEIERIDEAGKFKGDKAALEWVKKHAWKGVPHCIKAMRYINKPF